MAQATAEPAIKAYWQPGCTSCLRMKEFLTRHGVPFVSVNVLADKAAFAELAELGIRSVPIVRRGKDWANGQVLKDVARVAGIKWGGAKMLPVPELVSRLVTIQQAAQRLFAQIPDDKLGQQLPNRPRSYAQLAYHIFNIADAFLEHEVQGLPLKEGAYNRVPPPQMKTKEQILDYGRHVLSGIETWWRGPGQSASFDAKANVYYGNVTLHDYL
jgi:glutaredoxin